MELTPTDDFRNGEEHYSAIRQIDSPPRESGTFEPHGVLQNGFGQEKSERYVHEQPDEDSLDTALTTAPASLPKTCGCTSPTAEHLDHLDDIDAFPEKLQKALKGMSSLQRQYDHVRVASVCWHTSDTPELNVDAKYLQDILEGDYGYEVHRYLLNNADKDISTISLDLMEHLLEVRKHIDKSDMHNLFILHYAGHGGRSKDEVEYLWQPDSSTKEESAVKWTELESIIEKFKCDVLLLLDCCFAGGMLSNENRWLRHVELIGAAGSNDSAVFKHRVKPSKKNMIKAYTLTSAFAEELELRKDDNGTDISYIINYMQGKEASKRYHLTPSPTYRRNRLYQDSEVPRSSSIFLRSKLQSGPTTSDAAKTREEYIREISCLNDLRVVITLRLTNSAERLVVEDYKRWFYYRPQNIDLDNVIVEIECYGLAESNSSLAVLSLPWWLWNLLPPNPAYESIGVVRSHNFAPQNTPRLELQPEPVEDPLPIKEVEHVETRSPWVKRIFRQIPHQQKRKPALAIEDSGTLPIADFQRSPKSYTPLEHPQNRSALPRLQVMSHTRQRVDAQTNMERLLQAQSMDDIVHRLSRFERSDQNILSMIAKVARPLVAPLFVRLPASFIEYSVRAAKVQ